MKLKYFLLLCLIIGLALFTNADSHIESKVKPYKTHEYKLVDKINKTQIEVEYEYCWNESKEVGCDDLIEESIVNKSGCFSLTEKCEKILRHDIIETPYQVQEIIPNSAMIETDKFLINESKHGVCCVIIDENTYCELISTGDANGDCIWQSGETWAEMDDDLGIKSITNGEKQEKYKYKYMKLKETK